ncbi:MAG TPA: gamma-glutamyltransferase [Verrucomicrobiae bacterium]|jgi:gamma-glutamyltranspeptidase|nr:gamma-glutamyltransferase [Verrucomicrobiae bacterium]
MVVSPHSLASQAGVATLQAGGSAIDAAIAAAAVLAVVYPHMTSVGGDAFWLIHDARTGAVQALDAAGAAPAAATIDWFRERGLVEIPLRGVVPATVTVPGAVDGWCEAHARHGRLPLAADLAAAVRYAHEGFPVTQRLAEWIERNADALAVDPAATRIFLAEGRRPPAGRRLVNPDLARTLERLGAAGRAGFYEGETARALARWSRARGGFFTERDLAAQRARWTEPISATYRGVTIHETPPPSQGLSVLQGLRLVEPYDLGALPYLGPDHVHLLVQAKQIAFHDRDRFVADPAFVPVPVEQLLSPPYIAERRRLMDPARALPWDRVPSAGGLAGDTVYVGAVDDAGNAASLIQSLYFGFGAGVVAEETGVVLQNRGAYFSLDPDHPNRLEPGKRPLHTLIASLAFRDGRLWQVMGCMGADGQPQIHLQVYTAMIDFGLDIQRAVEAPRWLAGRFAIGDARDLLNLEGRFAEATVAELARRGHAINRWEAWNELAGHAHGITLDPASGALVGGADPRSDGAAIGY